MSNIAIISGGTATNSLISVFNNLQNVDKIAFILPISDNGGSSAEILRVFKGPAIGDLRSRITKLTSLNDRKTQEENDENNSFGSFFNHRLSTDKLEASNEWENIIKGTHSISKIILNQESSQFILNLLNYLNDIIVKKNKDFNFQNASIGNLFMVALRFHYDFDLYNCSEFFVKFVGINKKFTVIPSINSKEKRYNIAAELKDGTIIRGQSQISHPSSKTITQLTSPSDIDLSTVNLDAPQLIFQKDNTQPLSSTINRVYYINEVHEEYRPSCFEVASSYLQNSQVIIYSIGSLFTSIIPVLITENTANSIVNSKAHKKIFLLNGDRDRESGEYNGFDFLFQIFASLLYSYGDMNAFEVSGRDLKREEYEQGIAMISIYGFDSTRIETSLLISIIKLLAMKKLLKKYNIKFTDMVTDVYILDKSSIQFDMKLSIKLFEINCIKIKADVKEFNDFGKKRIHYRYNLDDFQKKLSLNIRI